MNKVEAILFADVHLCQKPPLARSSETDWLLTQRDYLRQVRTLAEQHQCPVVIAGDLFDKWSSSSEVVNLALDELPDRTYCCRGNHDLPWHSNDDVRRSSYYTLMKAEKIIDLQAGRPESVGPLRLWGFPWGSEIRPLKKAHGLCLEVAVIHKYVFTAKVGNHPGADQSGRLKNLAPILKTYHAVLIGDNHLSWSARLKETSILNPGAFMRRRFDEIKHKPHVGLLLSSGRIEKHYLDVSKDKFADVPPEAMRENNFDQLVKELSDLGDSAADFSESVRRFIEANKIGGIVREIILNALENKK